VSSAPRRSRNDLQQYDDLVEDWWKPDGAFAALHWLARARARLIPAAPGPLARLLDIGCGGGLLAPHVAGYRHVGVDLSERALNVAASHGVEPVRADAAALPFADAAFDVVVAGEVLEHVEDLDRVVAEALRVLRPGGTFVCDTINATLWARLLLVTLGERVPGGPPPACHDPRLFVAPERLRSLCGRHGVVLRVHGLRPSIGQYVGFLLGRRREVEMVRTRSLAAVYQGVGVKGSQARRRSSAA
jgi:2-polyprenyl-6-hydroxyphenyl methylase/3-demethylubiquinone-9 3-methyltransferase